LSGGGVFALLMYNLRRRFGHWIHGIFQVADFVWPYLAVSTTDASLTYCKLLFFECLLVDDAAVKSSESGGDSWFGRANDVDSRN
jgi:hypothetical protein